MGGRPGGPAEPAAAPMLALHPMMDRLSYEVAVQRDRLVRLQSLQNDFALDLPPSIQLPDGEEYRYGHPPVNWKMRDPEQEAEIYQKCIRPPPNKTVFDGKSPPSYRSSSVGLVPSDRSSGSSSSSLVVRCHSVSNASSKRPSSLFGRTVKCLSGKRCHHPSPEDSSTSSFPGHRGPVKSPPLTVIVPSYRCRRLSAFSANTSTGSSLATLPTVQCVTTLTNVADGSRHVLRPYVDEESDVSEGSDSSGHLSEKKTPTNKSKSKCDRSTV